MIYQMRSFWLIFIFCTWNNCVSSYELNVTVAYLTESSIQDIPFTINRTIGLVNSAMDKAREIVGDKINLTFVVRYADIPGCTSLKFGALASELYYNMKIDAIIGPGCSNSVTPVARLTAAWELPHITYGGTSKTLGNKTEFRTLTRLAYSMDAFANFYIDIFKEFGWQDIANVYDADSFLANLVGKSLQRSFLEASVHSTDLPFNSKSNNLTVELHRVLNAAKKVSRVFAVSCHGDVLRQLVLLARNLGMKQGEYIIIYFISDQSSAHIGKWHWERGDHLDLEAKYAYQTVMVVQPRRPISEEFLELERDVMRQALVLYNYTWAEGSELGIFHFGQYDAFVLYAHALKETIKAKEDHRDASKFNKHLWNRTYPGIGGMVYVKPNGDRSIDISLMNMEPTTGKYRMVAQYLGFRQQFELLTEAPIHWPNNAGPTENKPECGFVGELCYSYSFPLYGIITLSLVAVILTIIIIGSIVFRRLHHEAAIQNKWWQIKWEDINTHSKSVFMSTGSKIDRLESNMSMSNFVMRHSFGIYKGMKVHIEKPNIEAFIINRELLLELKESKANVATLQVHIDCGGHRPTQQIHKQWLYILNSAMRNINCPNLTRLIGVCPDVNNVCIVTEYCSRGSLQDILQNESIQLDEDFRISLVNDIVQGMHYIHTSPIEVHGRLSSSTCMIDSRFVLKVTGFGLRSITELVGINNMNALEWVILWMAPEILRSGNFQNYSQAGDVYSFAIILYEMCTRKEPYVTEMWYQSIEDTIHQIKLHRATPRRPSFSNSNDFTEISKLAIACWSEKPDERPGFSEIKRKLKQMQRKQAHGGNVLDMLLHRMEQYATNLEEVVEERTHDFLEEKQKSEALLYQVLPRSVADQLKTGSSVIPEAFECVTIYFSDIVGFTNISASSTPLQVVGFLNDLYTYFDEIIEHFDVYKVETIGDAYMVVSGLPIRNSNEHVRQISRMALRILQQIQQFEIKHQPDSVLKTRIGLHTGPVVAGVVGRKMPRYCLFGDTVHTASQMESNGKPMMIHISDSTRQLLEVYGTFEIKERGLINIKDQGVMLTHWLLDEISQEDI